MTSFFFFFQAEDGIRDAQESRGLGDVYKRQGYTAPMAGVGVSRPSGELRGRTNSPPSGEGLWNPRSLVFGCHGGSSAPPLWGMENVLPCVPRRLEPPTLPCHTCL